MERRNSQRQPRRAGQARRLLGGEEGIVLPSVLMLMAVLALVSATGLKAVLTDLRITGAYHKSAAAFHIAEAGLVHGRHEVADEDGNHDFAAILTPTTLFNGRGFHQGSYTVTAAPVAGAVPPRLRLRSSACYPAANPCPRANARAALEALLEHDPAGATPQDRVRVVAWRSLN